MIEFILAHTIEIPLAVTLLTAVWGALQYISIKKARNKQYIFETYHTLIKDLVEPSQKDNGGIETACQRIPFQRRAR